MLWGLRLCTIHVLYKPIIGANSLLNLIEKEVSDTIITKYLYTDFKKVHIKLKKLLFENRTFSHGNV